MDRDNLEVGWKTVKKVRKRVEGEKIEMKNTREAFAWTENSQGPWEKTINFQSIDYQGFLLTAAVGLRDTRPWLGSTGLMSEEGRQHRLLLSQWNVRELCFGAEADEVLIFFCSY